MFVALASLATEACSDAPLQSSFNPAAAATSAMLSVTAGQKAGDQIPGAYIVQFAPAVSDVSGLARQLAGQYGARLKFTYTSALKGMALDNLPSQAVEALRRSPNVLRVEVDAVFSADTTLQSSATWGLDRIDQRPLPLNTSYKYQEDGTGVTVYIVDTGIRYSHSEFGGRASLGFDAFGATGADCHGHGTHVAGTVGGKTYGVAKGVKLVAVRVLDCNGSGSGSGVIAGLDWIAKNGARPGVANLSLGGGASQAMDDAVEGLFKAGVVTAVAAGNSNLDACTVSPARAANAMTVGASDSKDVRAAFSNYGACLDWFAPGVSILSASHSGDGATATMSGTSMAAPHTAGAAALFLQRNTGATPLQVRDGLFGQASKAVINSGASVNNHALYSLGQSDNNWTPPPPGPPSAVFAYRCMDLDCTFTDASYDPDGTVASWKWEFGDGSLSTLQSPKRLYSKAGAYSVKLTVTDNSNQTSATMLALTTRVISLSVITVKSKATSKVSLAWSGATSATVEVWRSFVKVATVPNTGAYLDSPTAKGSVSGTAYQVCESGGLHCSKAYLVP